MRTEEEEKQLILDDIADTWCNARGPSDESDPRCQGCGSNLDGCIEGDAPLLRDGLCPDCWREDVGREQAYLEELCLRHAERIVLLGPDEDATFLRDHEEGLWVRKEQSAIQLPYFSHWGLSDEQVAAKIRCYRVFS